MIRDDLPVPLDEIMSMAEEVSREYARPGESRIEIPAYSDALWGAVQAIMRIDATPEERRTNPRSFIRHSMYSHVIDEGRKTSRFYRRYGVALKEDMAGDEPGDDPGEDRELLDHILSLKNWDDDSRKRWGWIEEVYIHGATFVEVGRREGMTVGQVKGRCYMLLRQLRRLAERTQVD